jgi:tetratricopeptide (TPR) repeat protein
MYHAGVQRGLRRAAGAACVAATTALAVQLGSRPAYAAGPDRADATGATSVDAPARTSPPSAQELADRAYELHEAGEYAAAIAAYLKAYEASSAAVTLLNIATIYDRKLHERQLAAEYYRRYLRAPDAEPDLVQKATDRLTALKQSEVAPVPPAPVAATTATDTGAASRSTGVRTAGFIVVTAGVTTLGASLVLGLLAKGKNDDANDLCKGDVCGSSEGVNLAHQANALATASTVTFCTSLVFAGSGLTMIVLAPGTSDPRSARLAVAPSLDVRGAGLGLRGAF